MKKSLRAKRMERHHARMKKKSDLNLTALMDIFTILVFFLMVNSSDVQVLKDTKDIKMPKSLAKELPKETLIIQISNEDVLVQGRKVASIAEVKSSEEDIIPGLETELNYQTSRRPEMTEKEKVLGRQITIQGDQQVPYALLKKVMATCASTEYRDISLAVTRILKTDDQGKEG